MVTYKVINTSFVISFASRTFVEKYYPVNSVQTEQDTLSLSKQAHIIFQNFAIILGVL